MIEELKKAGLNDYQARAYLALVKYGTQMGREVAKHSGIPPTRVFDVLRSLVEKGLVNIIEEKPMVFRAISPEKGFKQMIESKIEDLREAEGTVINSLKIFKRPSQKPEVHEKISTYAGYKKMFSMVVDRLKKCKAGCDVFSVGEEIPFSLKAEGRRSIKRGIRLRLIVTKSDEENKHILKERKEEGWKLKHYPSTGEWTFAIFDRKITMLTVRNPGEKEERIAIFFENPGLAKALSEYYTVLWKKAKPIKL